MERIRYLLNLLIVFLILLTVAINRDGRIMGTSIEELGNPKPQQQENVVDYMSEDGIRIIESKGIVPGVLGYAGPIYLRLEVKDGDIAKVEVTENTETPSFYRRVVNSGLLNSWDGKSLDEAITLPVDALSGATYTSNAIIQTVQKTATYAASVKAPAMKLPFLTWKNIIGALVILSSVVMIFFSFKSRWWRIAQLVLNVVVLGFWCGSFLSLSLFVNWISNGVNLSVVLLPFILLVLSILLPLFGKRQSYCAWQCPMGSFQELMGRAVNRKIKVNQRIEGVLKYSRDTILLLLLFFMWIGLGFELMDYEVFTAFIFKNASVVVLVMAVVFLLLSCFINRPYCRYVCPTGALIKFSQNTQQFKNKQGHEKHLPNS